MRVRVILGTMPFGGQVSEEVSAELLRLFVARHTAERRSRHEIDTARMYNFGSWGCCSHVSLPARRS
jgi:hypothetical protein